MTIRELIRKARRNYWRIRLRLKNVDKTFLAGGYSSISTDLEAGAYSYIGPGCEIGPGVTLGAYSMIGPSVKIIGNDHIFNIPGTPIIFSGRPPFKRTVIGRDVWIGAGAIILAGVHIEDGSIIGAGSVVTKNIDSFCIVAGVPASIIKKRFVTTEEESKHKQFLNTAKYQANYAEKLNK
ncbi:acetyltransferase [Pseudomonas endophytica]|uniref:Acetyltransferase n=1 Tax=Pseudomonas endophytica TaxID=1563157 RepID=A0A0Q0WVC3_9PSED|nr:DapH/DapD/GlmU-related protein [Pseudomonas endophytica]KQB51552.1 acetyltransferase [Pseudomonas endophytica]